uniref:Histidine phosphatase family protein n=1 Tax=Eiseniibacteriota bacterium TaxID=2212470 RepID=A0A832MM88_UNCEI
MRRAATVSAHVLVLALAALSFATPAAAADAPRPGARTLLLVRHGHYEAQEGVDPEVGLGLSERGREQASVTGRWLAALGVPVRAMVASSMTRARETAALAAAEMAGVTPVTDRDLRECGPPSGRRQYDDTPDEMAGCRVRLERAWARYARPTAGGDSTDVLVCHGNVIRYFTQRAAGQPIGDWATLGTTHCGVTEILVRPDGTARLVSYNGSGHLPSRLVGWPPRAR